MWVAVFTALAMLAVAKPSSRKGGAVLTTEQRMAEEFVLKVARGKVGVFPPCLEGKTHRREVELFVESVKSGRNFYIPSGLDFYGGVTWSRVIKEAV